MSTQKHHMRIYEIIEFLHTFKRTHPKSNKADLEKEFIARCGPKKARSVFVTEDSALRFCEANTPTFSNVVLSLSALQKHDSLPVVICIVRPAIVEFRLANATFLRRISHSSHKLRVDNIRGSFLGHDIMDEYDGIPNLPEHFDELFAIHKEFTWEENVARLVEATNAIVARSTRLEVTDDVLARVLEAPGRAADAIKTDAFQKVEQQLAGVIERRRDELLHAAALDNVNIRGNTIEKLITGEVNAHRLDDLVFMLDDNVKLFVDIKTKLMDRASAPKAYNIDKILRLLGQPDSVFCLFFVGLDSAHGTVHTCLISIFDPVILEATRIQTHWAGRLSRGVTQLTGDLARIFADDYCPSVDIEGGRALLRLFVERQ